MVSRHPTSILSATLLFYVLLLRVCSRDVLGELGIEGRRVRYVGEERTAQAIVRATLQM